MNMCFSLACCGWMLLSSIFAFDSVMHAAVNATTTLYYRKGHSAKISCNFSPSNDTDIIRVQLKKNNNEICSYMHTKSSIHQLCYEDIRFIWISDTNKMLFELSKLQINDTGTYNCTVRRLTPPPEMTLAEEITIVNVIEPPVLSMSCVRRPNGSPVILCRSEGFYPAPLEQKWMRDPGEIINLYLHKVENYSKNADGSFTQKSYLELPSQMFNETIYYCWVNHSSLNKPTMANLSSSTCYEKRDVTLTVTVTFIASVVLIVFVIVAVAYKRCKRARPQSPVEVNVASQVVYQTDLQSDGFYSSLGDHHPVPCSRSPSGIWSPLNTD